MKIRSGYVSNSSSSSFIVFNLDKLSPEIINKIINYDEECYAYCKSNNISVYEGTVRDVGYNPDFLEGKQYHTGNGTILENIYFNNDCRWNVSLNKEKNVIELCTMMDNFDMEQWLKVLGVDFEFVDGLWFMSDDIGEWK